MKPRQPSSSLRTSQVPIPAERCFWKMRGGYVSCAPSVFQKGFFFSFAVPASTGMKYKEA